MEHGGRVNTSGDLGNIKTDRDGNGVETIVDMEKRWTIGGSKKTNIIGKAIVVHEKADDGTSQPSGNAGKRVGCGEISGKSVSYTHLTLPTKA